MLPWSTMMEQLIGALKNEKISTGVLGLMVLVIWYAHSWAAEQHDEYVKKSEFSELKILMVNYITDSAIVDAGQLVRDKKLALQIAEATQESEGQIIHKKEEINQAEVYRDCLIAKDPNCKHLKPPE